MMDSPRGLCARDIGRGRGSLAGLALALLLALGTSRAGASDVTGTPSAQERAAYWINRLVRGPEGMTFEVPGFHQGMLLDAERNLAAIPDATLERLGDPAFIERIQTQDDLNPWHAILAVLTRIASVKPDVARAWAVPAMRHPQLTLRRSAIEVFYALSSPIDGPIIAEAYERDGADHFLGPKLAELLFKLGVPWDSVAARAVYARGPADGPLFSGGIWLTLPSLAADTPAGARPDLLAWWGLMTDAAGPRTADPPRGKDGKGRSIDPAALRVVAMQHGMTSGARAAAAARLALGRMGFESAQRQSSRDLESSNPEVRDIARTPSERPATDAERADVRDKARRSLAGLSGADKPSLGDVATQARALRSDPSPDALALIVSLFRAIPVDPEWKAAHVEAYDGLVVRGGSAAVEAIDWLFHLGTENGADLAFFLVQRSTGPGYVPLVKAFLTTAQGAGYRVHARRVLAYIYVGAYQHGGVAPADVEQWAGDVRTWTEDESDPSATGFVSALGDLGPIGARELAAGLRGPKRPRYLEGLLAIKDRYLSAEVLDALVGPVERSTSVAERRAILSIAFYVASGSAASVLESLAKRLPEAGRTEVESIVRIVRHRYPDVP